MFIHRFQLDLSLCLISNILQAYSDFFWANSSFPKYECGFGFFKNFWQDSWNGVSLAYRARLFKNIHKDMDVWPGHTSITTLLYGICLVLVNLFSMMYRKTCFCHSTFWGNPRISDFRIGTIKTFQRRWQAPLLFPISDEIRSKPFIFKDSRKVTLSILSGFS